MITPYNHARKLKFAGYLLIMLFTLGMSGQTVRYVKQGGTGDGTSWTTASGDLQAMITSSQASQSVWVAAGEYTAASSFSMVQGVAIYGGFPATGNPGLNDRNWTANPTVLKAPSYNSIIKNTLPLTSSSIFDGFTLTGSRYVYSGGGIYNSNGSPTFRNLLITDNMSSALGGGIYVYGAGSSGSPSFTNIIIRGNKATNGAGFYCNYGSPVCTNVLVTGNIGDGIYSSYCAMVLLNSTVSGNTARQMVSESGYYIPQIKNSIIWGTNPISNISGAVPVFTNSIVQGSGGSTNWNTAYGTNNGGNKDDNPLFVDAAAGNYNLQSPSPAINTGNTAVYPNAATAIDLAGNTRLYNVAIDMGAYERIVNDTRYVTTTGAGSFDGSNWANASPGSFQGMINQISYGQEIWVAAGTYYTSGIRMKEGVKIYGGFPSTGNPTMADRNWSANSTILETANNAIINNPDPLTMASLLDGFTLRASGNNYYNLINNNGASPTFSNLRITHGGGSYGAVINRNCSPLYRNVAITGCRIEGYNGGVIYDDNAAPTLLNVTIANITLENSSYSISSIKGTGAAIVRNSVLAYPSTNSAIAYYNSFVKGTGGSQFWSSSSGIDGGGNKDGNPLVNYDGTLQYGSPAINAGNTAYYTDAATAKDLSANQRVYGSSIDMGAFEDQGTPNITTRYVKVGGTGNGTSWAAASGDLQAMILNSQLTNSIWVAAGEYTAESTFSMADGVAILGGFPATGNPGPGDRDWKTNVTTLRAAGYNSVITNNTALSPASVLDGFTITGGSNVYRGGGINSQNGCPTFRNLLITGNTATQGGGVYVYGSSNGSSTSFINVIIRGNTATDAAGIYATFTPVICTNVLIAGNNGTGISSAYSTLTLTNSTIAGNSGGQMRSTGYNYTVKVNNSIIWGTNAVTNIDSALPIFTNSLVQGSGGSTNWNSNYGSNNGNNKDADPLFVNAPVGNYNLLAASPAVDAGTSSVYNYNTSNGDLAGQPRYYGTIDMGAYENRGIIECVAETTWTGATWSNRKPNGIEYSATINGNYNSSDDGEISACSLTVNDGDVVIAEYDNFTIKGIVTVDNENATFTIQRNANLIQTDDVDNVGTISVIKESAPMYRLDYALWSSPVAGQKLKAFSPETLDNRFYTYNPSSDAYATVQNPSITDFAEGKSYLIRVDNTHPAFVSNAIAPTPWEGTFIGVPNNGNVDVPVTSMADGTNGYNGVGNPYPSSINIVAFFEANQNNLAEDSPIYFWRKKNDAGTSSYCSLTLAGYNQNSGNAFGDSSNGVFDDPNNSVNWVINPGQGFIVQAAGNTVTFNNEMRVAVNNGQMFRSAMDVSDKSRLWLNITNTDGAFGQATIAYTPFTTLDRDFGWDGKALTDGEIAIYSLAGENKFGIQARPAFDPADEVPMEYKITTAGNYTISLDHFDGVFAEGQEIYVRDNVLGATHNLENPYQFTTEAGIIPGRFDIVYAEALNTDIPAFNSNSIIVYKQGTAINISTGNINMMSVALYDIRGRMLYSANDINAAATTITNLQAQEEMLIVEITTVEGVKASRKIIF